MVNLHVLPSVEQLLQMPLAGELIAGYGRSLTLKAIRTTLEDIRASSSRGEFKLPDREEILNQTHSRLRSWIEPTLIPVINASGVILHTNLGRAPLSLAAMQAMDTVSRGYSNLEYDLGMGKRSTRFNHVQTLFERLTGAESALVVNNNAAAILLVLSSLASKKRVVIARSQLVEIGGGFRIPDVMKLSGARLIEVGTTNRVHLSDYEEALAEPTALVIRAHRSNFKIVGFTEEPELREIIEAAHKHGVRFIDDLGSGALLPTERYGLGHEPMVQESLKAGANVICFSGDKLLGGPQAGIILGKVDLLEKIKKHPLARAVRADKLCLAGLTATLLHYLKDEAEKEIPIWRMITATPEQMKRRAGAWKIKLENGQIVKGESTIGGGSLPGETLPTYLLSLSVKSVEIFLLNLRQQHPPIIARTEKNHILLDPRTVLPEQEEALLKGLKNAFSS